MPVSLVCIWEHKMALLFRLKMKPQLYISQAHLKCITYTQADFSETETNWYLKNTGTAYHFAWVYGQNLIFYQMLIIFNFFQAGETAEKIVDNHVTLSCTQFPNEKSINDAIILKLSN